MNTFGSHRGSSLTFQRCYNHAAREAVARCPECQRYFCRECVTEHDDRVLCAVCLGRRTESGAARRRLFLRSLRVVQLGLAVLAVWFFFFMIATGLTRLPDEFHEGTLWTPMPTELEE